MTHVYVLNGEILIPTVAMTDAGFYMEVEPVEVVREPNIGSIASALQRARSRGIPQVTSPTGRRFPKPAILSYTREKSLNEFERNGRLWKLEWIPDGAIVTPTRPLPEGGWADLVEEREEIRSSHWAREVAQRLLENLPARG